MIIILAILRFFATLIIILLFLSSNQGAFQICNLEIVKKIYTHGEFSYCCCFTLYNHLIYFVIKKNELHYENYNLTDKKLQKLELHFESNI